MDQIETVTAGWYNLFYTLAIAVATGAALWSARRRGWNLSTWGFAVAAWVTGGVIGAMLPHLIAGPAIASKTFLGAIGGGALALAASATWLRLPVGIAFDNTALAIPLGGAVVRIGCFLAGCCHGTLTSLPFGVRYRPGTEVFARQLADGRISANASAALPIHPVQLYEMGLDLLVAAVVLRSARRLKRPGSSALVMAAGLGIVRFVTEFVRDSGDRFGGLSLAQWVVTPLVIGAVALLIAREKQTAPRAIRLTTAATVGRRAVVLGTAVFGTVAMGSVLSPLEATAILLVLCGCGVALVWRLRAAQGVAPIGMAVLMLQTPAIVRDSTYPHIYRSFGIGADGGAYRATHTAENCDGVEVERWTRDSRYGVAGIEAGVRREASPTRGVGLRLVGFGGAMQADAPVVIKGQPRLRGEYSDPDVGVTLIGDMDWHYLGLSFGATVGSVSVLEQEYNGKAIPWAPAFGFRIGPVNGTSIELKAGDNPPSWAPKPLVQFGAAVGDASGNRLRFGISDAGFYVAGRKVSKDGIEIAPFAALSPFESSGLHGGIMVRKWYR